MHDTLEVQNQFHRTPVSVELIFNMTCFGLCFFGGFGGHGRQFWEGLGLCGTGLQRLGQAMEPLNRILDASWWRLEEFWRRLEAL